MGSGLGLGGNWQTTEPSGEWSSGSTSAMDLLRPAVALEVAAR